MHPALILLPAVALVLGPRLWVKRVLARHAVEDDRLSLTGAEVARELLDRHGLQAITVEATDGGDHYDPKARAVRLTRDKLASRSLTATTTAAHEVGHAIQHASDYPPFLWRARLVRVAVTAGEAGSVLLLAVPLSTLLSRQRLPPVIVASAALGMLGTAVAAQLAALPTELNASFRRALPMLQEGIIDGQQIGESKQILLACSLTYVAGSLAGALHIWPWLGRGPVIAVPRSQLGLLEQPLATPDTEAVARHSTPARPRARKRPGRASALVRTYGKPLIKGWMRWQRGH